MIHVQGKLEARRARPSLGVCLGGLETGKHGTAWPRLPAGRGQVAESAPRMGGGLVRGRGRRKRDGEEKGCRFGFGLDESELNSGDPCRIFCSVEDLGVVWAAAIQWPTLALRRRHTSPPPPPPPPPLGPQLPAAAGGPRRRQTVGWKAPCRRTVARGPCQYPSRSRRVIGTRGAHGPCGQKPGPTPAGHSGRAGRLNRRGHREGGEGEGERGKRERGGKERA